METRERPSERAEFATSKEACTQLRRTYASSANGWRFRNAAETADLRLPKPMVPILNDRSPNTSSILLRRHQYYRDYRHPALSARCHARLLQDGSDFGVQMTYAVEEDQPLGTAGCVKNIAELLNETFLVISGDSITDFDLPPRLSFTDKSKSKATMVLTHVPNPIEFGVVITDEEAAHSSVFRKAFHERNFFRYRQHRHLYFRTRSFRLSPG